MNGRRGEGREWNGMCGGKREWKEKEMKGVERKGTERKGIN